MRFTARAVQAELFRKRVCKLALSRFGADVCAGNLQLSTNSLACFPDDRALQHRVDAFQDAPIHFLLCSGLPVLSCNLHFLLPLRSPPVELTLTFSILQL